MARTGTMRTHRRRENCDVRREKIDFVREFVTERLPHTAATITVITYRDLDMWKQGMDLVEGHCRKTTKAYRHHVSIAMGSHGELETGLELGARLAFCRGTTRIAFSKCAIRSGGCCQDSIERSGEGSVPRTLTPKSPVPSPQPCVNARPATSGAWRDPPQDAESRFPTCVQAAC